MKIRETKIWTASDVRNMCIRNQFCTEMDNAEYDRVLQFVFKTRPTRSNIFTLAIQIVAGSNLDKYSQTWEQNIESVMYELNEATHTFYSVEA